MHAIDDTGFPKDVYGCPGGPDALERTDDRGSRLRSQRTAPRGARRQVLIVRDHVLSGWSFSSVEEMDAAFAAWVPQRGSQIHKTHREVIGERAARDHAALKPLPPTPYLVAERHLRPVGKDA
ncbi:hypothetical protein [Streptomyces sp. CA-106131]|uniref:hypothetical protein n=1 Tax=Streptomyces sp. CA-106131 TaxID=3240045 RepID=UPI003D89BCEF